MKLEVDNISQVATEGSSHGQSTCTDNLMKFGYVNPVHRQTSHSTPILTMAE